MVKELADCSLRRATVRRAIDTSPFLEAAQGRCVREMRIEWQKYNLIQRPSIAERRDGFFRKRVPIAHSNDSHGINIIGQSFNKCAALPFGQRPNRRTAANFCILFADWN